MHEILILGAGAMGTAFCFPLADAGNRVTLIGTHLDSHWIQEMQNRGVHPKLQVPLPERVTCRSHEHLAEALTSDIALVVLGVSSAGVQWAIDQLGPLLRRPIPILMLTKGLAAENNNLRILPAVVHRKIGRYGIGGGKVGAVAGPCIAAELAARRDTSVVFACAEGQPLDQWTEMAATPYYHIRSSTDMIGVEICAALKNFYTLAIGAPPGWLEQQGERKTPAQVHNLCAGLFTQAIEEMAHIVALQGGNPSSVYGLAGSGDLYVTCQAGRNSRMGRLLGSGRTYTEAKSQYMPEDTVEGAELALAIGPALEGMMKRHQLSQARLPLTFAIIETICRDRALQLPWENFYRAGGGY